MIHSLLFCPALYAEQPGMDRPCLMSLGTPWRSPTTHARRLKPSVQQREDNETNAKQTRYTALSCAVPSVRSTDQTLRFPPPRPPPLFKAQSAVYM